jgi:hypothetical protein
MTQMSHFSLHCWLMGTSLIHQAYPEAKGIANPWRKSWKNTLKNIPWYSCYNSWLLLPCQSPSNIWPEGSVSSAMAKWTLRISQSKVTSYLLARHFESVLNSQGRQDGFQETRQVTLFAPMEPKDKTSAMYTWILTSKTCLNWSPRYIWWSPEE